jgi:hypothetical protein
MSTKRLISCLILTGLVLTPVLGLQYWLKILPGLQTLIPFGTQIVLFKVAKDVLLCAIFILFLLDVLRGRAILCDPLLLVMMAVLTISFMVTAREYGPMLALAGLRGLSPLLLAFVAYSYLDITYVRRVVKVLGFLLLLEFCAACVRAQFGLAVHGLTYLGLAARPCGTFVAPSSWSIFLCFIVCYMVGSDIQMFGRPRGKTWCFVGVAAFLVFLSGSGAGILAMGTVGACWFLLFTRVSPYIKASLFPLMVFTTLAVWAFLPILTRRPAVFESANSRVQILSDIFLSCNLKEFFIGRGLGIGSNIAVTLTRLDPRAFDTGDAVFIADSLYGSLMAQAGILFLLAFLALNLWVFRKALVARYSGISPIVLLVIPVTLVGALGNVVTEVFPVNWLLFILYGIALRRDRGEVDEGVPSSEAACRLPVGASECV